LPEFSSQYNSFRPKWLLVERLDRKGEQEAVYLFTAEGKLQLYEEAHGKIIIRDLNIRT
jgi:hypothetical protein